MVTNEEYALLAAELRRNGSGIRKRLARTAMALRRHNKLLSIRINARHSYSTCNQHIYLFR